MGRRGRRTIVSQLLETLRERLFAIAQAEILFNSAGMVCELEAGTIRFTSIISIFVNRVGCHKSLKIRGIDDICSWANNRALDDARIYGQH